MKKVLLVDASVLFDEFLKTKLGDDTLKVESAGSKKDAFQKMITGLPDLIIVDIAKDLSDIQDFLDRKLLEPNAVKIPMILSGPQLPHNQVVSLMKYGVVKYFAKPIKFDIFFDAISKILRTVLTFDTTPSLLQCHVNGNIIFVDLAQGLNRDKITIFKYKLAEILDKNNMHEPKIILMMSDMDLSFMDGANLELLFDTILEEKRIRRNNVKVLTMNQFTKDLIAGHPIYHGIQAVSSLSEITETLVSNDEQADIRDVVSEKILSADDEADNGTIGTQFGQDNNGQSSPDDSGTAMRVAVVDDDPVIRELLKGTFSHANVEADLYEGGKAFIEGLQHKTYDAIILDVFIPDMNGLEILQSLQAQPEFKTPILIYSQTNSRETVIQTLSLGAKGYLTKPQKPQVIVAKTMEILNS